MTPDGHACGPSRRRFLRQLATAAASAFVAAPALIPARALGRDGAVAPSSRLAIGVVGASHGIVNANRMLPFRDVQITAVCDVDSQRLERAVSGLNRYYGGTVARPWRDFREMFSGAKLDAVILAAPDHWHGVMSVAAARAGLDIWGEAPFARTIAEGRAIVESVRLHGSVWQTGTWRRSVREYRRVAEFVRCGGLGLVTHVEIGAGLPPVNAWRVPDDLGKPPAHLDYEQWVGPGLWSDYDSRVVHHRWRWVSLYGGGVLSDVGSHFVDIAQWALGTNHTGPVSISATGQYAGVPPFDTEYRYHCLCSYEKGVTLAIASNIQRGVRFYGERGWIFIGDSIGILPDGRLEPPEVRASSTDILDELPMLAEYSSSNPVSDDHWRNFADSIKTRRTTTSPAPSAHRATSIIQLARIAFLTGRTIRWNPDTEEIKNDESASLLLKPASRLPWMM